MQTSLSQGDTASFKMITVLASAAPMLAATPTEKTRGHIFQAFE